VSGEATREAIVPREPRTWRNTASAIREYGIYFALLALIGYFSAVTPEFRTLGNALLILLQVAVNGILAIGMTFTILTAGIDLSVGSLLAVSGMLAGVFAQRDPTPVNIALTLTVPLAAGLLGGAINGVVIAWGGVNPLIVTLGTLTAYRGFVVWYRVNPIYNLQPWYRAIGEATLGPVPLPVVFLVVTAVLAAVVLSYTRFGRYVYVVGGNQEAARAAGINVRVVKLGVYVISGFLAGLGGLIFTARLGAAQAISGQGFELLAIAGVVVGGASLFGGRGTIANSLVGALIIGVLFNGLVMLNVPSPVQQMVIGGIIIAAVWVDGVLRERY
jgi:ribose/xylose/arabinose/galactoside ABC-type transport system permease subunit